MEEFVGPLRISFEFVRRWFRCGSQFLTSLPIYSSVNRIVVCRSASLSSVDSEESLRAAERLHNRQSRNSAGGISTHSLNEAELVVSGSVVQCCSVV